ncbi:hypothetical protein HPB52_006534 [Rhipicephalus sanguineus]|uniref:Uncharacterized protein n=1 Tax=Rhipicephalus sanguineus TaxID=34632 RepID=A0A9D4SRL7_RHISA|nr:hypothetical protein HPB52_006534 [Rhipicephalus sanguineus]
MRTVNSAEEVELDPQRNHGVANVYDNRLDGRTMFPTRGYLVLAWKELAKRLEQPINEVPVIYEDVSIHRATSSRHRDLKCDISFLRSGMRTVNSAEEVELDPQRNHGVANVYDNRLDGRTMFPASGYLVLAWKELAKRLGKPINGSPVKVFVGTSDIMGTSGEFMVVEGGSVAATGLIRIAKDERKPPDIETSELPAQESTYELEERDVYQELRLRGYEYEGCFRGIIKASLNRMRFRDACR